MSDKLWAFMVVINITFGHDQSSLLPLKVMRSYNIWLKPGNLLKGYAGPIKKFHHKAFDGLQMNTAHAFF